MMIFIFKPCCAMTIFFVIVLGQISYSQQTEEPKGKDDLWGPVCFGVRSSISVERNRFSTGEPIVAKIILTNISKQSVFLMSRRPERDYKIDVLNDHDKRLPRTAYGKSVENPIFEYGIRTVELLSDGQTECELEVSKIVDMTATGHYRIAVSRQFWLEKGKSTGVVTSNCVKVEVVP